MKLVAIDTNSLIVVILSKVIILVYAFAFL